MTHSLHHHRRPMRRAFSLPEVMFAVMIFGIGFIMVAAMFPVAIQQAKDSRQETTAAEITKAAVQVIQQLPSGSLPVPAAGGNKLDLALNQTLYNTYLRGSLIYASNGQYAWTALYRRGGTVANPDPFAQIYVFTVNSGTGQPFNAVTDADTLSFVSPQSYPNLFARRVDIQVGPANDQVYVHDDAVGAAPHYPSARATVVENAYLVTEDGSTFRVASSLPLPASPPANSDLWQLYPGQNASAYGGWTKAWLIGRASSGGATPTFAGTAQDISMFTTFVRAN